MSKYLYKIIFITFLIALSIFLYFLLNKNKTSDNLNNKQESTFGQVVTNSDNDNIESTLDINYRIYGSAFKDQPDGKYIYGLGLSLIPFDYDALWNFEITPFLANVKDVSVADETLTLNFIQPRSMPFLGTEIKTKVVGCNKDNSFMHIESQKINAINIDFLTEIKPGDGMIGYCLNQECTQVGKLCKIYRY